MADIVCLDCKIIVYGAHPSRQRCDECNKKRWAQSKRMRNAPYYRHKSPAAAELARINAEARAAGMSYGYYVAQVLRAK